MIVKNESRIIERLIKSVLPLIDSYCICDTGSTDDTPAIIERVMREANIPGEVVHEPFKNFGYNRTFALNAAKSWGDFALLIDADMRLVVTPDFSKDILTPDVGAVLIKQKAGDLEYYNVRLINLQIGATCRCPTHEYYDIPSPYKSIRTDTLWIDDVGDGGCKADKFERDINLLKAGLEEEPNNPRYHFYLANSYTSVNRPLDAITHYKRRIEIGGWIEEIFYSCLQLGHMYKRIGDIANAIYWWTEGYNRHSGRAESLYEIVKHYRIEGKHKLADAYYQVAKTIPYPKNDSLFVQTNVYTFELDYEQSILAYYTKKPVDHRRYLELLGTGKNMGNLLSNYQFYARSLIDIDGVRTHGFSDILMKSVHGRNDTFVASSSSIIPDGDGYLMNVRYVNYLIQPNGSYTFHNDSGKITTINQALWLDRDFQVRRRHWFDHVEHPHLRYQGIEDVRLFKHGSDTLFLGTVQDISSGHLRVGTGRYDTNSNRLTPTTLESPEGRDCEKNWAYFTDTSGNLRMIYDWGILKIVDASGQLVSADTNVPGFFKLLRGSTCGVHVGDNELWFVCHFVEYSAPRKYYHIIVVLNRDTLTYKRHSIPFKFGNAPIEYTLGVVVEPDRILFPYSQWDRSAAIMSVNRTVFDREFFA